MPKAKDNDNNSPKVPSLRTIMRNAAKEAYSRQQEEAAYPWLVASERGKAPISAEQWGSPRKQQPQRQQPHPRYHKQRRWRMRKLQRVRRRAMHDFQVEGSPRKDILGTDHELEAALALQEKYDRESAARRKRDRKYDRRQPRGARKAAPADEARQQQQPEGGEPGVLMMIPGVWQPMPGIPHPGQPHMLVPVRRAALHVNAQEGVVLPPPNNPNPNPASNAAAPASVPAPACVPSQTPPPPPTAFAPSAVHFTLRKSVRSKEQEALPPKPPKQVLHKEKEMPTCVPPRNTPCAQLQPSPNVDHLNGDTAAAEEEDVIEGEWEEVVAAMGDDVDDVVDGEWELVTE